MITARPRSLASTIKNAFGATVFSFFFCDFSANPLVCRAYEESPEAACQSFRKNRPTLPLLHRSFLVLLHA